ncbi:unnamed protein product [Rotaria magnacalcarata]|uniref:RING-type domain-containing protein n=1 Tax=Rotaria magnacalcarata TaxID=392030 RepID=A0A816DGH0_9BILA|nr:unnamed protein product [Rotaria magnacalcarata]CAF4007063.1 unnamed protein product [Rotaria magnacalcarata]CAF5179176.1 unnamed protein product [Rotaria magnacalcarata]
MNDDWSRCPICYEDYSLLHRPTTFVCGHSTCIDHMFGHNRLHEIWQTIVLIIQQSGLIQQIFELNLTPTTSSSEIYVRGSQSDLNDIVQNEATSTRPSIILSFIFASLLTLKKNERKSRQLKKCGHYCFLTLTPQCCSCSDQRPYSENNHYDAYIDGHGIKNLAQRNRHYCPGCKKE